MEKDGPTWRYVIVNSPRLYNLSPTFIMKKIVYRLKDDSEKMEYSVVSVNFDIQSMPLFQNDVLIKVHACGLSSAIKDYQLTLSLLRLFAINYLAHSSVTRFFLGDQVVGFIPLDSTYSGCGQYCVISAYNIVSVIELGNVNNASLISACLELTGGLGVDVIVDNGVYNNCLTSVAHEKVRMAVDQNVTSNAASMATDAYNKYRPYVHDIISCLAIGGSWITSQADLQIDPPDTEILYMKGASVGFIFEHAWTLSSSKQGCFLRILS
ncbi:uncharacterized protein TRIADDRAFT_56317 [Trichoplax adhaerens]|uniref:Uncharacterized protein n=1 Tax=Trichoplax adhaerens TaxID=10228 RepID=B3RXS9_TRIAD|nr:hypothetical protein TRIADDRAFT_56317 [Trichoplax adhaerens]EDV24482.1 hypothetical protein TRIADDRAFT_56317 [Trichoplax adhaerens]|eukprot:XP_002112372.1 hypothetical protein TRIADDRAFT_56317 [Trichoplax adhaerens]